MDLKTICPGLALSDCSVYAVCSLEPCPSPVTSLHGTCVHLVPVSAGMCCPMLLQVSEVLSHKCRLSVSGWFHGPSVARPARHIEAPLARSPHIPYDVSNKPTSAYLHFCLCPVPVIPVRECTDALQML